jgi:hypothetical protein
LIDKTLLNKTLQKLGKLPKRENMSEDEKKFYSEVGSALLQGELESLIDSKQWMAGIIVTALMLHFVGKTRLIWHHAGSVSTRAIENYDYFKTMKELRQHGIIDDATFDKMDEIRKVRNSFAHNLLRQWSASKANPKIEKLIKEGISIISTLF